MLSSCLIATHYPSVIVCWWHFVLLWCWSGSIEVCEIDSHLVWGCLGPGLLFSINEVEKKKDQISADIGMWNRFFTYIIPWSFSGAKNKSMEIRNGVTDKREKRLARWKTQYLSCGKRIILVNSILDSLPTYVMSLSPLPPKVEKRLDSLRRNFIWKETRRIDAFISWDGNLWSLAKELVEWVLEI